MLSRFFLKRPVFAWVIAIILMVAGCLAIYKPAHFAVSSHRSSVHRHHRRFIRGRRRRRWKTA